MDPAPGEQVFFHGHPSWRSIIGYYVKGLVLIVLAGALAGVITDLASNKVRAEWIVAVVLAGFVVILTGGLVKRIQTTYTITNQRLTIHTGIFSRELHETRLERVQNVNSSQSPLERLLRVGTVAFDTAGEAGYDFSFRGVSDPRQIVRTVDQAIHELHARPDGV